ncbi:YfgM family protein [Thioalkalivibrio thiocyanodenitrificans]|uniref:YfgM family protein n=1 Tax=Thioalkalivibrio thiocyanodenitrificans TaxID=243063 RepID=UPI00036460DD|nr:tetratricopeptide repeat protein [Thioalkalivibrio thiocyanodenitrificans]
MTEYTTDEEKVEAIKRWWKENGTSVIAGIVLGLAGLFGWRYWVDLGESRAEQASDIYMAVHQATRQGNVVEVRRHAETLKADYARTPYASMAAMELAHLEASRGDLARSEESLRWAIEHASSAEVAWLARVRLARVLLAGERPGDALSLVQESSAPPGFEALVEELRGDVYRAQGDHDRALQAYDRAMGASAGGTEYLQMKRDEVAALAVGAGV